jgi:hypothetical protein
VGKLEQVFDRISRSLSRLGVPTKKKCPFSGSVEDDQTVKTLVQRNASSHGASRACLTEHFERPGVAHGSFRTRSFGAGRLGGAGATLSPSFCYTRRE